MLSSQLFPPSSAFFCARARPSMLMEPDGYIDPSFGDDGDVIDLGLLLLQDQQQKSLHLFILFLPTSKVSAAEASISLVPTASDILFQFTSFYNYNILSYRVDKTKETPRVTTSRDDCISHPHSLLFDAARIHQLNNTPAIFTWKAHLSTIKPIE